MQAQPPGTAAEYLKTQGNAAFKEGRFAEAAERFSEAITLDPTNHALLSNRSGALAALGRYDEALVDADQTIHYAPEWAKGYSRRGAALFGLGHFEEALRTYEAGSRLDPSNAQIAQAVVDVRQRLLDANSAPAAASGASSVGGGCAPPSSSAAGSAAKPAFGSLFASARSMAEKTKSMAEKTVQQTVQRASAVREDLQRQIDLNRDKAAREAEEKKAVASEGRQSNPLQPPMQPPMRPPMQPTMQPPMLSQRDLLAQPSTAQTAGGLDMMGAPLHTNEAQACASQEQFSTSTGAALAANPATADDDSQFAEGYRQMGNEAFAAGRYEEAMDAYTQALKLDPNSAKLYSNRSGALAALGRYDSALADAERCVTLLPDWAKGHTRKAAALHGLQRYLPAIVSYEIALRATPNDRALLQGRRQASFALALER